MNEVLYLGIDGGGSKCRARIEAADGRLLGNGLSGPANPAYGLERACASIIEATDKALQQAGMDLAERHRLVAGLGIAGVNQPDLYRALNSWAHPFRAMYLANDVHIACLGAHRGQDGGVIIAGTGSHGYVFANGHGRGFGGYGFALGDQGSGAAIGLDMLRAVLLADDGLGPATCLAELLLTSGGMTPQHIMTRMHGAASADYAAFAPLVFQAAQRKDAVALRIVQDAAGYIDALVERLFAAGAPRVALVGGVAASLMPWLDPTIATRLSPQLESPEVGAVLFARGEWATGPR